ncbi:EAL domain-containing protein [Fusibacter bizertensis]|uniref:EAL domain-containing protein n=1 Tax=Fusibacter bizertensis TaxID=1488331 RepID=A0ABT6NCV1_9FIRM|nr:EAL domain-containing protein [Fusibacter bizertensis]MDH8678231.1 EAL domain-containing protein [Fusibacter bizertensis]
MLSTIDIFQYFIMSVILLSNTNYVYFAIDNIIKDSYHKSDYILLCLKYSLITIVASIIYVVKLLIYTPIKFDYPLVQPAIIITCTIAFLTTIGIYIKLNENHRIKFKKISPNILISIVLLLAYLSNLITIQLFYNLIFVWFLVVTAIFSYQVIYTKKIINNSGVYFLIASASILSVVNLLSHQLPLQMVLTVNLGIESLIIYGLFLFYSQFYVDALADAYDSEIKQANELRILNSKITKMAYLDAVTGIENEIALMNDIEKMGHSLSLITINIRNFSLYNQILGFSQGNTLLYEIAHTLSSEIEKLSKSNCKLYKLHSDKFIVLCNTVDVRTCVDHIDQIKTIFLTHTFMNFRLDAYYGISSLKNGEFKINEFNSLIGAVELASKHAKLVPEKFYFLSLERYEREKSKFDIEFHLKEAIELGSLEVYYQPQIHAKSKQVCSYEALIRWQDRGKFISPAIFIPIAENTGLITEITHFVIEDVFKNIYTLQWNEDRKVSINLSAIQLVENGFVDYVKNILLIYPINTSHIVFEVTETALTYDLNKVEDTIKALKSIGFEFSLDDFGDGYSSLNRLSKLNFDEVKFDKFFIQDIANDDKLKLTFLKTVELFDLLNLRIVVEGVETPAQETFLDQYPIDVYQGYLYSEAKPLSYLY